MSGTKISSAFTAAPNRNVPDPNISVPERIQIRNISEFLHHNLYTAFGAINFDYLDNLDCDEAVEELHPKVLSTFNNFCPSKNKTESRKDARKTWINCNIKAIIKKRQSIFISYKQNKLSKITFNRYRNYVTSKIRTAKKEYYHKLLHDINKDIKKTWSVINDIIRLNCIKNSSNIKSILCNNIFQDQPHNIASQAILTILTH